MAQAKTGRPHHRARSQPSGRASDVATCEQGGCHARPGNYSHFTYLLTCLCPRPETPACMVHRLALCSQQGFPQDAPGCWQMNSLPKVRLQAREMAAIWSCSTAWVPPVHDSGAPGEGKVLTRLFRENRKLYAAPSGTLPHPSSRVAHHLLLGSLQW